MIDPSGYTGHVHLIVYHVQHLTKRFVAAIHPHQKAGRLSSDLVEPLIERSTFTTWLLQFGSHFLASTSHRAYMDASR